jgi:hypothetical protein
LVSETPREFYLRAVVKVGQLEVVMGLEFDPRTEDIERLRWGMKHVANQAIERIGDAQEDDDPGQIDGLLSDIISTAMGKSWPRRRYFLEVQHDDPDEGWVQVITPSGWPPKLSGDGAI